MMTINSHTIKLLNHKKITPCFMYVRARTFYLLETLNYIIQNYTLTLTD